MATSCPWSSTRTSGVPKGTSHPTQGANRSPNSTPNAAVMCPAANLVAGPPIDDSDRGHQFLHRFRGQLGRLVVLEARGSIPVDRSPSGRNRSGMATDPKAGGRRKPPGRKRKGAGWFARSSPMVDWLPPTLEEVQNDPPPWVGRTATSRGAGRAAGAIRAGAVPAIGRAVRPAGRFAPPTRSASFHR